MKTTPCKGCKREIVFGLTEDGKRIPLDPRPPVYAVIGQNEAGVPLVRRHVGAMVSHFATCPNANDFSGSRK